MLDEQTQPLQERLVQFEEGKAWWDRCRVPRLTPLTDAPSIEKVGTLVRSHHAGFMELAYLARKILMNQADALRTDLNRPEFLLFKYIEKTDIELGAGQDQMVGFVHRNSGEDPRQVIFAAWICYRRASSWIQNLTSKLPDAHDPEEIKTFWEMDSAFRKSVHSKMTELQIGSLSDTLSWHDPQTPC